MLELELYEDEDYCFFTDIGCLFEVDYLLVGTAELLADLASFFLPLTGSLSTPEVVLLLDLLLLV